MFQVHLTPIGCILSIQKQTARQDAKDWNGTCQYANESPKNAYKGKST